MADTKHTVPSILQLRHSLLRSQRPLGPDRPLPERRNRRLTLVVSVIVKLGIAGLAIAGVIQLRHYWLDHAALGTSVEEYSTISTGLPVKPPVQWAGLPPTPRPPPKPAVPPALHVPATNPPLV